MNWVVVCSLLIGSVLAHKREIGRITKADPPCRSLGRGCDRRGYMDLDGLLGWFDWIHEKYPTFTKIYNFGSSVQNRPLKMLEISDQPGDQTELEPNIKLVANMHGDEVVGQSMLLLLANHLLDNYDTDPAMKEIVDSNHIFIIPTLNPDGFGRCSRENGNGVDLNRNFPDRELDQFSSPFGREPETAALMNISQQIHFTLSANMHGGDVVVNYPFDSGVGRTVHSEDEDVFVDISLTYSKSNSPMYNSIDFRSGITNGATWYVLHGGMQDWNYVWAGCMEFTFELSCYKWPPFSEIPDYWNDNRDSLLNFIQIPNKKGVRGVVVDSYTGEAVESDIMVEGRPYPVFSDSITGKYFRILLPGTYTLIAKAAGYKPLSRTVTITEGETAILNFDLESEDYRRRPNEVDEDLSNGMEVEQDYTPLEEQPIDVRNIKPEAFISMYGFYLFVVVLSLVSVTFVYIRRRARNLNAIIVFNV